MDRRNSVGAVWAGAFADSLLAVLQMSRIIVDAVMAETKPEFFTLQGRGTIDTEKVGVR